MPSRNDQLVLAALKDSQRALSAYEILDLLRADGISAPPTVYRALARLVEAGAVHRIESMNAFAACDHGGTHEPLIAICSDCGQVNDLASDAIQDACRKAADALGFALENVVLELRGQCEACRKVRARQTPS